MSEIQDCGVCIYCRLKKENPYAQCIRKHRRPSALTLFPDLLQTVGEDQNGLDNPYKVLKKLKPESVKE